MSPLREGLEPGIPLVVSYGLGVDSTGLLVGLHQQGLRPAAILFADTGSEKEETYAYLATINTWLRRVGFPEVTVVRYRPRRFKWNQYETLEGNCISNRTLPSLAFGKKSCSLKWKGAPLDAAVTRQFGAVPVYRAIGYDCSPADNKRFAHAQTKATDGTCQGRPRDRFVYPLQVWDWTREDCMAAIQEAGLPVPPKSSCFFCPAMKADEVRALPAEKLRRLVIMEANAFPNLEKVAGLWRGKRMTDFIRAEGLLPGAEVDALWAHWSGPERLITDPAASSEEVVRSAAGAAPWAPLPTADLFPILQPSLQLGLFP